MPELSRIIRDHQTLVSTGATEELLRSSRVPSSELWHIRRYSFRLRTDELTLVRSFIDSGSDRFFLNEWVAPANPFLYVDTFDFDMADGEQLVLEIAGAGFGDVIDLFMSGRRIIEQDDPRR